MESSTRQRLARVAIATVAIAVATTTIASATTAIDLSLPNPLLAGHPGGALRVCLVGRNAGNVQGEIGDLVLGEVRPKP